MDHQRHVADHILLGCRTDTSGSKYDGLSMISVRKGTDGMEIRGIDTMVEPKVNDVYFTHCFVPSSNVVGQVGGAWMQLMAVLNPHAPRPRPHERERDTVKRSHRRALARPVRTPRVNR